MAGPSQWDEWHDGLEPDRVADEPWYALVKAALSKLKRSSRILLEVGCGRGGFACWMAQQANPPECIQAVDYSAAAIRKGRALASALHVKGLQWTVGDIQDLPTRDETFDTVVSCETIEHVPSPGKAVKELARVLVPGGVLLLTTPNYLGPMGAYRAYCRVMGRPFTEVGQPINKLTHLPRTLWWLRNAGLRAREVQGVGHYFPWPGAPARHMARMDSVRALKWFALHTLVVAEKPSRRQ